MKNMVEIGKVAVFDNPKQNKAQALKPLEESAEIFSAWQSGKIQDIVDECADTITATCNLLYSLGITDMTDAMERCKQRNHERGRL